MSPEGGTLQGHMCTNVLTSVDRGQLYKAHFAVIEIRVLYVTRACLFATSFSQRRTPTRERREYNVQGIRLDDTLRYSHKLYKYELFSTLEGVFLPTISIRFSSSPFSIHRMGVNSWDGGVILQNESASGGSKFSRNRTSLACSFTLSDVQRFILLLAGPIGNKRTPASNVPLPPATTLQRTSDTSSKVHGTTTAEVNTVY